MIIPFYDAIYDLVKPFYYIFKVSLKVGSTLSGIFSTTAYCLYAVLSGKNLEKLNNDFDKVEDLISLNYIPYLANTLLTIILEIQLFKWRSISA